MLSAQDVLSDLTESIRQVIGEDWILDETIEMTTSFADDLELESIEFVALAERLQETYGAELNFVHWLSNKELDEIIGLTVGEVVEFITTCQS